MEKANYDVTMLCRVLGVGTSSFYDWRAARANPSARAVADAELMAARQSAFRNDESRIKLTTLQSRAQERRAELASIRSQLERLDVSAPRDGIAVFADVNDWLGKPVVALNTATYWHALRQCGIEGKVRGFGRLLAEF